MSDYRIVFNATAGRYRVEKRGWFGWSFVINTAGTDYLEFADLDAAQRYVCAQRRRRGDRARRWRVVDPCARPCR